MKNESEMSDIRIEMEQEYLENLDASLEQVYFRLVKANANMNRQTATWIVKCSVRFWAFKFDRCVNKFTTVR
jgi:hypothetical protein